MTHNRKPGMTTPRTLEQVERELTIQKRITEAAINSNAHWDDVSEALVWERVDYQEDGPISAEHMASVLARFPQFADDIRNFVSNWNQEPRITEEMLAAIEFTPTDEAKAEAFGRQAVRILNFYAKLRKTETELTLATAKIEELKEAVAGWEQAWKLAEEHGQHQKERAKATEAQLTSQAGELQRAREALVKIASMTRYAAPHIAVLCDEALSDQPNEG